MINFRYEENICCSGYALHDIDHETKGSNIGMVFLDKLFSIRKMFTKKNFVM